MSGCFPKPKMFSRGFNVPMQDGGNKDDGLGAPRGALKQLVTAYSAPGHKAPFKSCTSKPLISS